MAHMVSPERELVHVAVPTLLIWGLPTEEKGTPKSSILVLLILTMSSG